MRGFSRHLDAEQGERLPGDDRHRRANVAGLIVAEPAEIWMREADIGGDEQDRPEGRRSEEHTSELQSQSNLVCRLLLDKKNMMPEPITVDNISHDTSSVAPSIRHSDWLLVVPVRTLAKSYACGLAGGCSRLHAH